jgi:hypothetical protein
MITIPTIIKIVTILYTNYLYILILDLISLPFLLNLSFICNDSHILVFILFTVMLVLFTMVMIKYEMLCSFNGIICFFIECLISGSLVNMLHFDFFGVSLLPLFFNILNSSYSYFHYSNHLYDLHKNRNIF